MKHFIYCIPFLFFSSAVFCQSKPISNSGFGLDIIPPLLWSLGGDKEYSEVEFIYRETQELNDLRFKFTVTNFNFLALDVIRRNDFNALPDGIQSHVTRYEPVFSYLASIGYAKYLINENIPIYFGLDASVGVSRGRVQTSVETRGFRSNKVDFMAGQAMERAVLGLTPVLGLRKDLTDRFMISIDFGLNFYTVLGKEISYEIESSEVLTRQLDRLHFRANQIISDIALLIKI